MQIIDNKALLLRLRDPDKVINAIPKSKAVGNNQVVVNWGLEEARSLNQLGIKSPSPIEVNTHGQDDTNHLTTKFRQHHSLLYTRKDFGSTNKAQERQRVPYGHQTFL